MFKRILETLSAVCLATSMAWAAQSQFIGEWKLDPLKTRMPDEMKVQSQGGEQIRVRFWRRRRNDRCGWERPAGLLPGRCCR